MSLLSRLFYKRPPDGLLEFIDRIYVFDSCFLTDVLPSGTYHIYLHEILNAMHEEFAESSFLAFNFKEGEKSSHFSEVLSKFDVTIYEYPRHYEGCPLLPLCLIHHFLRVCDSWLSLGNQQNIILLHCERGGWPLLAFLLASILIFRKFHNGEHKTLEIVHHEAPKGFLKLLSPLNPLPSQLRYLQYVARRNISTEWPPRERILSLDCVILRGVPSFDFSNGCRPLIRLFGQSYAGRDSFSTMLFAMSKKKSLRHYKQVDCDVIKMDIQCLVQGDIVLECVHQDVDPEREVMMFRVMFNTAFIRSNILMLNCEDLDTLWDSKDVYPRGFRTEILFGEPESISPPRLPTATLNGEEKGGLPIEAFSKIQEIFGGVEWDRKDAAASCLLRKVSRNPLEEKIGKLILTEVEEVSSIHDNIGRHAFTGKENDESISIDTDVSLKVEKIIERRISNPPSQGSDTADAKCISDDALSSPFEFTFQSTDTNTIISSSQIDMVADQPSNILFSSLQSNNLEVASVEHLESSTERSSSAFSQPCRIISTVPPTLPSPPIQQHDFSAIPSSAQTRFEPPSQPNSCQSDVLIPIGTSSLPLPPSSCAMVGKTTPQPPPPPLPPPPSACGTSKTTLFPLTLTASLHGVSIDKSSALSSLGSSLHPLYASCFMESSPLPPPSMCPKHDFGNGSMSLCTTPHPSSKSERSNSSHNVSKDLCPSHQLQDNPSSSYSSISSKSPLQLRPPPPPPPPPPLPVHHNIVSTVPTLTPTSGHCLSSGTKLAKNNTSSPSPPPPLPSLSAVSSTLSPPPPMPPPPPPVPPLSATAYSAQRGSLKAQSPARPPPPPPPPPLPTTHIGCGSSTLSPPPPMPPPPPPMPPLSATACSAQCGSLKAQSLVRPPPPPPPLPTTHIGWGSSTPSRPPPPPPPPLNAGKNSKLTSGVSMGSSRKGPPPPPPPQAPRSSGAIPSPLIAGCRGSIPDPPQSYAKKIVGAPAPPSLPGGRVKPAASNSGTTHGNFQASVAPKKAPLRPLHWVKVTRAMQGSLWADSQKQENHARAPEIDMIELESLFSTAAATDGGSSGIGGARRVPSMNKPELVHLVDMNRSKNCEIMLTKYKMPLQDMLNAILALSTSALDIDQVENLIKFCPTKEEMVMLKNYTGNKESLGKCEQFFLELMKVPRVESKLRVFAFRLTFSTQVKELKANLKIINDTSREVKESVKLRQIMQTILTLGNALNQGTARGSAVGFRLDSLLKLSDTRARNNKITLMHYLCKLLREKMPELLDFDKDLIHLEAASKIQLKVVAEEMQAVSKGLEKVEQELTASKNDGDISTSFCKASKDFLDTAEAEVRSLISLYSEVGRSADSLAQYFGEDPARCPFEQVTSILVVFVNMFKKSRDENEKLAEAERKKSEKEAVKEKGSVLFKKDCSNDERMRFTSPKK